MQKPANGETYYNIYIFMFITNYTYKLTHECSVITMRNIEDKDSRLG